MSGELRYAKTGVKTLMSKLLIILIKSFSLTNEAKYICNDFFTHIQLLLIKHMF